MRIYLILIFLLLVPIVNGKRKIIYKYKSKQLIDLGNLEIKGTVIAPGDISIKDRNRKHFDRNLLDMPNFDRESIHDIKNLR